MEKKEITGYELSRNFFDWCFENPEKISPSHSAIFFFAIEHCNRLGWKSKFGFPTQMVMDAIGIKKHETYIRYLNDLIEWGFLILIQKSTNQYSANIISISNAVPKNGKALEKASRMHGRKQTESIGESTGESKGGILKQDINKETIQPITTNDADVVKTWRDDFEIYKQGLGKAFLSIKKNTEWIIEKEKYHPNVDIILSIEKSCKEYWATEKGWKNKKSKKDLKNPDWDTTFANLLNQSQNKVYKPKSNEKTEPTANYEPIRFNTDK